MTFIRGAFRGAVAACALAAMGLAGLSGTPGAPAQAAEKITYLLPAPPFLIAFGPWTLAKQKGYYKAEGLEVTFQTAKGGVDVAKQVGAGNALIGGGIGDTPIIVRPNGIPVKAVALLGGRSLMQLVVHADSGINGPKDLKGKTITTMSYQDTTYYALLGMMASAGLNKNDANIQAAGPVNTWKLFLARKAQAMAAVPDWTGIALGATKGKVKIFPSDKYFQSMSQAILVADKTIKERPELVRKLVRATLKGMKDIMADPDAAAVEFAKAVPRWKGKEKNVAAVFKLYNKYVYPGQKVVGMMDEARLAKLQDFYKKRGFIRKVTPVKDLYTNEFVTQ